MEICKTELCTGCGMCMNVCKHGAISMHTDKHGFLYPKVDEKKCTLCNQCKKFCPSNNVTEPASNLRTVYAGWNKNKAIRKESTSGGIFSIMAKKIISEGGYVAGVRWVNGFRVKHDLISDESQLSLFYGSKYIQSYTGNIYLRIKEKLNEGKSVLFSGTPCQNSALRSFLGKEYANLFQIDLVCHGVPSYDLFDRYIDEICEGKSSSIKRIRFRHKAPFWDFCNVTIDFEDGTQYSVPTVDDPFFSLFNIGYSIRQSCGNCPYTSLERYSDITLADFWGFKPENFKMHNYEKGVSCILINSEKGQAIFDAVSSAVVYEQSTVERAKKANKSLYAPYAISKELSKLFWEDYEDGMPVSELCSKHVQNPFKKPSLLWLRILKYKYKWIFSKVVHK